MKNSLGIIDRSREADGFLSLKDFPPSKYELYRQLLVARDWTVFWLVMAAGGWSTVGIILWLRL